MYPVTSKRPHCSSSISESSSIDSSRCMTLSLEILGMMLSLEYWDISPFVYLTHSCEIKCFFSGWTGSILAVYASFCVWVWLAVCPPTDCWSSSSHHFLLGLMTLVHMNCKPLRVGRHESSSALCSPDSFFFFFYVNCHFRLIKVMLGLVSDF